MRRRIIGPFSGLLLLLAVAVPVAAHAALERVGPTDPAFGYPQWYQDRSGLILDFCSPLNDSELAGGWCLLLPPIPSATPEVFPGVFSDEHFYWAGTTTVVGAVNGVSVTAKIVLALEGAFAAGGVVPGDQIVFGRVRIVMSPVPVTGTYTVYTPFGTLVVPDQVADPAGRLFFTEDIGITCPLGRFDCALGSSVGPFLLPSTFPGGPELPPVPILDPATGCGPLPGGGSVCDPFWPGAGATPYPATGKKYITDPGRIGPVTGSPFPPFVSAVDGVTRDHNMARIEVTPAGATAPLFVGETTDFSLMGRIYEGTVAGRVTLDRASYARPVATPTGNKVDVFATALPTAQGRIPPLPALPPVQPVLVFYEAPCGVDAITGALKAPVDPLTSLPLPQIPMTSALGWKYVVGQAQPLAVPPAVCLEQTNGLNVNGNQISIFAQAPVTDQIFITGAVFDPNLGTFTVSATSSDRVFPPILTVGAYGTIDPATGQLVVPLIAPPNRVTVTSSAGGLNQRQVTSLYFTAPNNPTAVADAVTLVEDSPATAIAVLANDTMAGSALPAGGVVTLVTFPVLGTATVNLDGTVTYTPNPNAWGTDSFSYTVTLNGIASNIAGVTITITPVNDLPVAVNDNFAAGIDLVTPTAVPLDVFANDTDPDGKGDLASAINLVLTSAPAGATATLGGGAGGIVSFTASVAGTYTFTYQTQDKGGGVVPPVPAVSNVATATVVASAETVTLTRAEFTARQLRWVITGTASPSAGQTITIAYADGPNAGFVIGTATVVGGIWTYDFRPAAGLQDPTTAGATQVVATGPAGGTALAAFRIK